MRPTSSSSARPIGRIVLVLVALLVAVLGSTAPASAAVTAKVTGRPGAPELQVRTACFTAPGPDGASHVVSGRRYSIGAPLPGTPTIVLAHGIESSQDAFDPIPSWSMARWLAARGYTVLAYDRLGYGRSPYPGSGQDLTVDAQQQVLHALVGELRAGTYGLGSGDSCARTTAPGVGHPRIAVLGHSAGGFIVSGYPGRYHDVQAMIQTSSPSGLFSTDLSNPALESVAGAGNGYRAPLSAFPIGDPSRDGGAKPTGSGFAHYFPDRVSCEQFDFWPAGTVKEVATATCDPAAFPGTPSGEQPSYVPAAALNTLRIPTTDVPVLLVSGDHDPILPPPAAARELAAWHQACPGCDVTQQILPDTGHFYMGHRSLPAMVDHLVGWLAAHALEPHRAPGIGTALPPRYCGATTVVLDLGRTLARSARRTSVLAGDRRVARSNGRHRRITVAAPAGAGQLRILVRTRSGRLVRRAVSIPDCTPVQ